ncbi:hypothetical protein L21SP3_02182 [Sedimentisphaera cyanobacteriorum]|uniref:YbbR-like protein n=1 Tax=Sedimentisphaera cyanobacteriorum TaxID=1940790 RepID=A0A1Q2HSK4_9BACT|nr:hypothetical protein [Sedimentisphaera cyanobacteriorum]AQQ10350.1 hypothetical protein L21SP3_02182 [Sedimentisphaera cyanobacteriorum]
MKYPDKKTVEKSASKIVIVSFLTLLIWVWADLSNDTILKDKKVEIKLATSQPENLWVSLGDSDSTTVRADFKGPSARIDELKRELSALEVYFDPSVLEGRSESFKYPVRGLIQDSPRVRRLGLTVENCQPSSIEVTTQQLQKKQLGLTCIDKNNNLILNAVTEPASVEMYVPPHWSGDDLKAVVSLSQQQISEASEDAAQAKAYVEIEPGRRTYYENPVEVSIQTEKGKLETFLLNGPRIGVLMNENIAEQYSVKIISRSEALTTIQINSTREAYEAYKAKQYQMIVYVYPEDLPGSDKTESEPIERKVHYFFPEEYRKEDLISPVESGVEPRVTFKLISVE